MLLNFMKSKPFQKKSEWISNFSFLSSSLSSSLHTSSDQIFNLHISLLGSLLLPEKTREEKEEIESQTVELVLEFSNAFIGVLLKECELFPELRNAVLITLPAQLEQVTSHWTQSKELFIPLKGKSQRKFNHIHLLFLLLLFV